jgi:hypothetical protein
MHRATWMTVELGHRFMHTFTVTINHPQPGTTDSLPLVTAGANTISISATGSGGNGQDLVRFTMSGQGQLVRGYSKSFHPGTSLRVVVITDPAKHLVTATANGVTFLSRPLIDGEPIRDDVEQFNSNADQAQPSISVVDKTGSTAEPTLCQSLIHH